MSPILPGSTIGILGGGQLGRMTAMAARSLGYRVQVMDPNPSCPARFVVDACFEGSWDDARAAMNLARGSDVVTLEIEQVAIECLDIAAKYAPVRPGAALLRIIQDRILQKNWLRDHGFPVGEFRAIKSEGELRKAAEELGGRCFVKTARGGYDGRGQAKIGFGDKGDLDAAVCEAWTALAGGDGNPARPAADQSTEYIAERAIDFEREISVMVARSPRGEVRSFPSAWNHHERQILAWSVIPSSIAADLEAKAQHIAAGLTAALEVEGLLCIEMFLTRDGELLINEMAPRPHNSYHASERACATSQFEQVVRAICDLPLGDVDVLRPCAIANLLGELWLDGGPDGAPEEPRFDRALEVPGVRLHLYEKHTPRRGRKMGHLSAVGATPREAIDRVLEAQQRL